MKEYKIHYRKLSKNKMFHTICKTRGDQNVTDNKTEVTCEKCLNKLQIENAKQK